jgi:type II secretory pathway component PulF
MSASSDVLVFTRQFAAMVNSNLQLVPVLESLTRETTKRGLRTALQDIVAKVRRGGEFDRALADHPKIFNPTYVGVVRAGMQSGQLGEALQQVSEYLSALDKVMKKMRSAAIYPALLITAFLITFHILVFGVLPRFEVLFSNFGQELPAPTRFVLAIGDVYARSWAMLLAVICAIAAAILIWTRKNPISFDRMKLRVPLLGPLLRLSALARFSHTLAIQVKNSVSLIEAIRVAAPACNNRYAQASLREIADDIERGQGIAQAFARQELFRGVVQQMISAGEQSGDLGEPLRSAANYFENLWIQRVDAFIAIVNPVLTAVIGLLISGMLIAAFLPVFEVSGVATR